AVRGAGDRRGQRQYGGAGSLPGVAVLPRPGLAVPAHRGGGALGGRCGDVVASEQPSGAALRWCAAARRGRAVGDRPVDGSGGVDADLRHLGREVATVSDGRTVTDDAPQTARPVYRQTRLQRVLAFLRNTWRSLTSMRTALVLLFLLALAALPGALLPQWDLNAQQTAEYIAENGWWGELPNRLQFFDVYSSVWFSAIYLLLMVSLIGCLVPRTGEYLRAMRSGPVLTPRNLARLPHHARAEV